MAGLGCGVWGFESLAAADGLTPSRGGLDPEDSVASSRKQFMSKRRRDYAVSAIKDYYYSCVIAEERSIRKLFHFAKHWKHVPDPSKNSDLQL